jgi:hypothetical protein
VDIKLAPEFQADLHIGPLDKSVILICGRAGCGKDYAAEILVEFYEKNNMVAEQIAYADVMREIARKLGWTGEKTPIFRNFMQQFGTDVCRNIIGEDVWINCWFKLAKRSPADVIVVSDARFDNEVIKVCEYAEDSMVIKIVGKDREGTDYNHPSEAGISEHLIHDTIINDYTDNFRREVTANGVLMLMEVDSE